MSLKNRVNKLEQDSGSRGAVVVVVYEADGKETGRCLLSPAPRNWLNGAGKTYSLSTGKEVKII